MCQPRVNRIRRVPLYGKRWGDIIVSLLKRGVVPNAPSLPVDKVDAHPQSAGQYSRQASARIEYAQMWRVFLAVARLPSADGVQCSTIGTW